MAFTVTTSYQFPVWTQPNPAFNDGAHFRFKPLQTSHLTSNRICQHPISVLSCSHAAELILQYGLDMGHVRYSAANHRHAVWHRGRPAALEVNEQIQYCDVLVPAILLSCGLTLRTICRLIPHLHCRHTHTCTPKHTELETQIYSQSIGHVKERGTDLSGDRSRLQRMESWRQMWREKAPRVYTATLICAWGNELSGEITPELIRLCLSGKSVCLHSVRLPGDTFSK